MLWLANAYEELAVCEETNWSKKKKDILRLDKVIMPSVRGRQTGIGKRSTSAPAALQCR